MFEFFEASRLASKEVFGGFGTSILKVLFSIHDGAETSFLLVNTGLELFAS